MFKKFIPDLYIKSYKDLNLDVLKDAQIKLLLCDVDNTLVAHDEPNSNNEIKRFFNKVEKMGIKCCLVSNNTYERVNLFNKELGLKMYSFAKKPFKKIYQQIARDYQVEYHQMACLGDQLLTDIFGGNRMGCFTILCDPIANKDLFSTKFNRFVEKIILHHLAKTKQFIKGESYE